MPQAKQMAVFGDQTEEVPLHSGQIVWMDS